MPGNRPGHRRAERASLSGHGCDGRFLPVLVLGFNALPPVPSPRSVLEAASGCKLFLSFASQSDRPFTERTEGPAGEDPSARWAAPHLLRPN